MKTKNLARINNVMIQMIDDGAEKLIPIKPICEALDIGYRTQSDKIKSDTFLSSVWRLHPLTGSDGKKYQMFCIPFEYVFGWLFTINPYRVKPTAKEAVTRYRIECYQVLFRHFTDQSGFFQDKQKMIDQKTETYQAVVQEFQRTKKCMDKARHDLSQAQAYSFDTWSADQQQLKIAF